MGLKKILLLLGVSGLVLGVVGIGLVVLSQLKTAVNGKTFIVILQNNKELRPSGGFVGSYARINVQCSMSDVQCWTKNFEIQDIYVPDGQIVGHVDPPPQINQAFGQGWWKLRDSNWDPDFSVAGEQIAWFFEQGGEKADGVIAVNLSLVTSLLGELGEIKPTGYNDTVTAKSFYALAQKHAESGFFPGSTQKRDFLGAVGEAFKWRVRTSSWREKIGMAKIVWNQLQKKQIMMWTKDKNLETRVKRLGWGGDLGEYKNDYLYVVESNLGANKANCCVEREVTQEVGQETKLTIKYKNTNEFSDPKPPLFWGGNYIDYLRVIIPAGAEVQRVKVAGRELQMANDKSQISKEYWRQEDVYAIEERDGRFKIVGFWAVVPAQEEVVVELEYKSGRVEGRGYRILVKRQPGIESFPYKLIVGGKLVANDTIDRDKEFVWIR